MATLAEQLANLGQLMNDLAQAQIDTHNALQQLGAAVPPPAGPAPPSHKKVVSDPGKYDGSPQGFREWWSKMKMFVGIGIANGSLPTTRDVMATVLSHLEGPKAGQWAQVQIDHYLGGVTYPTWPELQAQVEGMFLPGNNTEWAKAQLLHLHQGPRQRIDDFLTSFKALKIESWCEDGYARDLLKRAVQMLYSRCTCRGVHEIPMLLYAHQ